MKKLILLISVSLAVGLTASAQSFDAFKQQLCETDADTKARVTVTEYGDAAEAVVEARAKIRRTAVTGYRIVVYLGNESSAREKAAAAHSLVGSAYPDVRSYMSYDSPYFKVSAGDCVTREEAIILLGRLRERFPKAYIMQDRLRY